jgi:hypothetical protein
MDLRSGFGIFLSRASSEQHTAENSLIGPSQSDRAQSESCVWSGFVAVDSQCRTEADAGNAVLNRIFML